jgi:hypothetical protein
MRRRLTLRREGPLRSEAGCSAWSPARHETVAPYLAELTMPARQAN